ncbi:MAG: hypothetical protein ACI8QC_001575 [Planctomycetota bacterium]
MAQETDESMPELLRAYPESEPRAAEAHYYLGLAQFHLGDPKQARASWKSLVETFGEARWSYRADWAYCQTTDEGQAERKKSFFAGGATQSLLGRHGYMGRQDPDLTPRKQAN